MRLSNAEIQKRYKKKLKKDGKWDEYLQTQRIHKQIVRQNQKVKETSADIEKRRKLERERKAAYRRAKKEQASLNLSTCTGSEQQPSDEPCTPFSAATATSSSTPDASQLVVKLPFPNPRSRGKALKKAKKNLPRDSYKEAQTIADLITGLSPGKKTFIADQVFPASKRRRLDMEERKQRSDGLSENDIKEVQNFFERDDISRMCPGKKDFVSVKTASGRVHRQKRLLIMNLREAHQLFLKESLVKIGISKFQSLRPPHVMPVSLRDQEVCLCTYHENVDLLAHSLHSKIPDLPSSSSDLVKLTVCDMHSEDCVDRQCDNCGVHKLDGLFLTGAPDTDQLMYSQWGKVTKSSTTSTIADAKILLYKLLEPFSRHVYNANRQHAELKHLKETLPPGEVILQEDFAENYALRHQGDIMSAHWNSDQVTLFTACAWFRTETEGDLQLRSYVVVSDDLHHNKRSVYTFNKAIIQDLQQHIHFSKVHYWSDGAKSQFKSRFNCLNLVHHERDFGMAAQWNFFATAHGKAPVDRIGGEMKRQVWRAVLQRKRVVSTPVEFFHAGKELCPSVNVKYLTSADIISATAPIRKRWEDCPPVPGIQHFHQIQPQPRGHVLVSANSQYQQPSGDAKLVQVTEDQPAQPHIDPQPDTELHQGDFVIAEFAARKGVKKYLGQVTQEAEDDEVEVSFLRTKGSGKRIFLFPAKEDKAWIPIQDVKEVVCMPNIDTRGHYLFSSAVDVTA